MATRVTRRVRALATGIFVVLLLASAAACTTRPKGPTYPPADATPAPAGPATDAARGAVSSALGAAGLQAVDPQQPYVPQQGPWFAAAPRTVLQVSVPNEAGPRYIVLYAFASSADASSAAADQASYVSRGPGKVYFPSDAHFVIRVLGSVAIFFTWSPGGADPKVGDIETALDTIGSGVAIPA